MRVEMTRCDHCGKRVENPYAERGWIQLTYDSVKPVSVSRSTGEYKNGCYQSDFLQRVVDFCSVTCLVAALDRKAQERADAEAKEKGLHAS